MRILQILHMEFFRQPLINSVGTWAFVCFCALCMFLFVYFNTFKLFFS